MKWRIIALGLLLGLGFLQEGQAQFWKKKAKAPVDTVVAQPPKPRLKLEVHRALPLETNAPEDQPLYVRTEIYCDSLGRPSLRRDYLSSGKPKGEYTYTYEEEGRLQKHYYRANEQEKPYEARRERYDAQARITELQSFKQNGELIQRQSFSYDHKGRLSKEEVWDGQGNKIQEMSAVYDEEVLSMVEYFTDMLSQKTYQTVVSLDSAYRPLERHRYLSSGSLVDRSVFVRDEAGQLLQQRRYKPHDPPLKPAYQEEFMYLPGGAKIRRLIIEGEVISRERIEYQYYGD